MRTAVLSVFVATVVSIGALAGLVRVDRSAPERPDVSTSGLPAAAARVLASIRDVDREQYSISQEDGRFLRVLAGARGARRVLEIGAARGYSAIWMGLALRDTGGELVTIEFDPARAEEARQNVERAGLASTVRVIAGDAFVEIPKLSGLFDMIFLDAWKPDYLRFFDLTFPRLTPGGVFVAHNVVNKREDMGDFLGAIESRAGAWTTIVSPSGEGMSLTYKVRR